MLIHIGWGWFDSWLIISIPIKTNSIQWKVRPFFSSNESDELHCLIRWKRQTLSLVTTAPHLSDWLPTHTPFRHWLHQLNDFFLQIHPKTFQHFSDPKTNNNNIIIITKVHHHHPHQSWGYPHLNGELKHLTTLGMHPSQKELLGAGALRQDATVVPWGKTSRFGWGCLRLVEVGWGWLGWFGVFLFEIRGIISWRLFCFVGWLLSSFLNIYII